MTGFGRCAAAAESGELVSRQCARGQLSPCIFEYIYLARPDSVLNDIPVYSFQLGLGTRLAQRIRCAAILGPAKASHDRPPPYMTILCLT